MPAAPRSANSPFDGDNTFGFLTMVCAYPFVYSVPKDLPIKSFPDMLARAKANPGKLTYSSPRSARSIT